MKGKETILIVDDDESTRKSLSLILKNKGYQTETAETGEEAVAKARGRFFNAGLLDIKLPDMPGIELLRQLKEMHPEMVIILVTGYASLESATEALNEGAVGYLTKPLKMDEMLAKVREALDKQRLVMENRRLYQETQRELAERKRAEQALRQSEKRYRKLFEDSREAIFVATRDGRFVDVNQSLLNLFGYNKEGMAKLDLPQLFADHLDWHRFQEQIEATKAIKDFEVKLRRNDWAEINCLVTSTLWQTDDGTLLGYQGIISSITDRKSAEQRQEKDDLQAPTKMLVETLDAISALIEARDPYATGHAQRVAKFALQIGREMGLPDAELEILQVAALLHDVGKLTLPDAVLNKPTRLTRAEWQIVRAYPEESARVAAKTPGLQHAVPAIRRHQECWDGTGYPDGLKHEEVPLLARVLAVADRYDSITCDQPGHQALSESEAMGELRRSAGTKFDPEVVEVFLNLITQRDIALPSEVPVPDGALARS